MLRLLISAAALLSLRAGALDTVFVSSIPLSPAPLTAPSAERPEFFDLDEDLQVPTYLGEHETAGPGEDGAPPPEYPTVRGVHLTSWVGGSTQSRTRFLDKLKGTVVNAVVIPLKESDGRVYVPGIEKAHEYGSERIAIPQPRRMLADLRDRGLYTIARIVVFKDNVLPVKKPEWAIRDMDGGLWRNDKGLAWVDPYRREVWEYNLDIAVHAAELGFDEIQFDYIRFPSDGKIKRCRYSRKDHSGSTSVEAMNEFLRYARKRLESHGVEMSVAVFGMTATASDGLGIGQRITDMIRLADHLSPMMYPSHYRKGAYGLKSPNHEPYKVIKYGLRDAKRQVGENSYKLRPYLQDFSLGVRYGPQQVLDQIRAAREHGIENWILWNPVNRYNWDALRFDPPRPDVSPPDERSPAPGRP
ncbi:MAG: putative glycoside hydrolase [Elusimicrobiota bacterium]